MGIEIGGLLGLLILIADIWAIIKTVESGAGTGAKVLWVVLILVLPVLGLILWLLFLCDGKLDLDRIAARLEVSTAELAPIADRLAGKGVLELV